MREGIARPAPATRESGVRPAAGADCARVKRRLVAVPMPTQAGAVPERADADRVPCCALSLWTASTDALTPKKPAVTHNTCSNGFVGGEMQRRAIRVEGAAALWSCGAVELRCCDAQ